LGTSLNNKGRLIKSETFKSPIRFKGSTSFRMEGVLNLLFNLLFMKKLEMKDVVNLSQAR
jgi:hypothetical protein